MAVEVAHKIKPGCCAIHVMIVHSLTVDIYNESFLTLNAGTGYCNMGAISCI